MKRLFYLLLGLGSISAFALPASDPSNFMMSTSANPTIVVNNRVLAKIKENFISVVDVMKKMDMVFYREYPHLSQSIQARYQFYTTNWKIVLEEMIDNELIVADATEKKLQVSDGDVRQELEDLFGPNVVMTIDNFGLTFKEAWDLILTDLTVKKMTYAMVSNKAMHRINPKDVRQTYDDFIEKNPAQNSWLYRVLSVQGVKENAPTEEIAQKISDALHSQSTDFDTLDDWLKARNLDPEDTIQITISPSYERTDKDLSAAYKETLSSLSDHSYSPPVAQRSRQSQELVYRIFYLEQHVIGQLPSFSELQEKIKDYLIDQAIEEETKNYRIALRKRFRIDEEYLQVMVPDGFTPFTLT